MTPVEETIAALHELVAEGKVRYLGHSNSSGWQLADAALLAARNGHTPFISAQNHWSLLERAAESDVKATAAAVEWLPSADEMAEIDGIVPPPASAA